MSSETTIIVNDLAKDETRSVPLNLICEEYWLRVRDDICTSIL
jgi:hypothetical protein